MRLPLSPGHFGRLQVCDRHDPGAGSDVSRLAPHRIARGHAALVPEGRRLFLDQSVEDNLLLGAFHLRRAPQRVESLLESVYELFPVLRGARKRSAAALSGVSSKWS